MIDEGDEDEGDSSQKFKMQPNQRFSNLPDKIDEQDGEDEEVVIDSDACFDDGIDEKIHLNEWTYKSSGVFLPERNFS